MPTIDVDFETFKAITARRASEKMTEGDVVREALGIRQTAKQDLVTSKYWQSEGVKFEVGMELDHTFRDGRRVVATIVPDGVKVEGKVYGGLSPAGVAVAGYQLNGWRFWGHKNSRGQWVTADSLRG